MSGRGTVLGGRYTLTERIGGGGMGAVWRAEDAVLGRPVAVKILHPALLEDGNFAERFRREARLLAALDHPGIVDVHDYGEEEPPDAADGERLAYLVMELVDGRPLHQVLAADGAFPPDRALGLLAEALDALHAAHRRGIVHRDVKPSNLMLRTDGRVTVTDFGIARTMAGTRLTASHAVIGTALYMAPEQAEGKPITPAADLYAIGVVGYELLTGKPPFTGEGMLEVALKHLREPVPELPEGVPPAVRAFLATALAKDPDGRFADAAAMAAAARAAADGEAAAVPPAAAPPPAVPAAPVRPADDLGEVEPSAVVVATTEPSRRTRRRGFLVPVVLPIVISVGTATALLVDRSPFISQAQEPSSPPVTTVTVTAQPAAAPPTGAASPASSATSPAAPTTAPPTSASTTPPKPTAGTPATTASPKPSTGAPQPGQPPAAAPTTPQPPQQSTPATTAPGTAAAGTTPAGCGGTNWGYITNVGDGLRMGLSQDGLAGGQAVVMGGATAYGWVHTVPSSWHQFNPCKLSAPALVQEMDGRVALSGGFSVLSNWTVTAATTPGAFYLKDYMGQSCLTDNGLGAQLTMTACTPGNKAQEFRIP
ncbi:serine/threonine-protein kinase [Kitasatospora misakiensis]|uniref:non-specific serine/threonine protein kinase n=1 Tax=Kitasatospora misakiensis TaxID=67330 RepID=A0ABW0X3H8_9ACTN